MAAKLQNADFLTAAQITGAGGAVSQLLNTSKIYDSVNGQLLDTTIAAIGVVGTGVAGRLALYPANGNSVDDIYVQNLNNIDVEIAAHPGLGAARAYTIPDAGASASFLMSEGAQTINAIKTFNAAPLLKVGASFEDPGVGTNAISLTAPSGLAAAYTFTLPPDDGTAGQYLQTDGAGVTTWASPGSVAWLLAGNTGTGGTGVLGTTDAQPFSIITNGTTQLTYRTPAAGNGAFSLVNTTVIEATTIDQWGYQTNVLLPASTLTANFSLFGGTVDFDGPDSGFNFAGSVTQSNQGMTIGSSGTIGYAAMSDNNLTFGTNGGTVSLSKVINANATVGAGFTLTNHSGVYNSLTVGAANFAGVGMGQNLLFTASTTTGVQVYNASAQMSGASTGTSFSGLDLNLSIQDSTALSSNLYGSNIGMTIDDTAVADGVFGDNFNIQILSGATVTNNTYGDNMGITVSGTAGVNSLFGLNQNLQLVDAITAGGVTSANLGFTLDDTAAVTSYTGVNVNPTIGGTASAPNVTSGSFTANIHDSAVITNLQGLLVNPQLQNTASTTNFTGLTVAPSILNTATSSNLTGINVNLTSTPNTNNITGLSVDVSSANSAQRRTAINASGGVITTGVDFTTTSSFPSVVDTVNNITTIFNVVAAAPISDTDVIGNSLAGLSIFSDNYSSSLALGLGYTALGFVGQVSVLATKTASDINMALAGFSIPATSTGGTATNVSMYRTKAPFAAGGTLTITNLYGLKIDSGWGAAATNAYGIHVSDADDNLLGSKLYVGATYAAHTNTLDVENTFGIKETATGFNVNFQTTGTLAASYTLTLPPDDGTAGQFLQTNGSGVLVWANGGAGTVSAGTVGRLALYPASGSLVDDQYLQTGFNVDILIGAQALGADRTYTIPDAGASTDFVMAAGAQTIAGVKTFSNTPLLKTALDFEDPGVGTNAITMTAPAALAASYTFTLPPDDGTAGQFLQTDGAGVTTWQSGGSGTVVAGVAGRLALYPANGTSVDDIYVQNANDIDVEIAAHPALGAARAYTIPDAGASADFVMTAGAQTIAGIKTFSNTPLFKTAIDLEDPAGGTNKWTIQAPTLAGDFTLTLPTDDGAANQYLKTDGSGVTSWSSISLTTDVTGVLPLANGGTNKNLTASNGAIVYSDADSFELSAVGATGQVLQSNGAGAPTWSTPTYPSASGSAGQIIRSNATNNLYSTATFPDTAAQYDFLYASAANTWASFVTANTSALVTSSAGVPSWASGSTANRVLRTDGTTVSFSQVALATDVSGTLPVANGVIAAQAIGASAIDWATGYVFTKTLGANTTFTFSNQASGQTITVRLTNTVANYTVTWPTVKWTGGVAPTMSPGATSDVYTFVYDGTDIYGSYVQDMF